MKRTRRIVQFGFLALVLVGVFVFRGNAERWCPFGGVEGLYAYVQEGTLICSLGTSNFFILGGVLVMALLVRRAFCGYMCPIGTLSEWLHSLGKRIGVPSLRVPYAVDRALALLKYVVLAWILLATWQAGELLFRGYDPCYALISRHGTDITHWAYVVSGLIGLASLVIVMPFCRWFCPLAAVLHPFSRFGLARIKRDPERCTDCGRCSKACPMGIPVDRVRQVKAARCTSCMSCVEACPIEAPDAIGWGPPDWLGRRWPQAVLIAVIVLCTAGAVSAAYLFPIPSYVKARGTPPDRVATVEMKIENLSCRGRANLLLYFLERDDMDAIPGYFKLEAWPGPGLADVRITFDPARADETTIRRAITEPYFEMRADAAEGFWRISPFRIEGYDPVAFGLKGGLNPAR